MARNELGYSLVELLVVSSLLLLLLLGVSTLFIASLTADARITLRQELRAEGNYALDSMSYFIRNAKALPECQPGGSRLSVLNEDGRVTEYSVSSNQIASYSATFAPFPERTDLLTVLPYEVETGSFKLDCNNVNQPYVTISFTLTRTDSQGTAIENDFRHTVLVRNQL